MAIEYKLRPQKIKLGEDAGKTMYYAKRVRAKKLSFDALCQRMSKGTLMEECDIHAVLIKLYDEIVEYTSEGYIVDCGKLGYFYPSFGSEGVENEEDFRPLKHMRLPKLRYRAKKGYDYLKKAPYIRIHEERNDLSCSTAPNGASSTSSNNGNQDDRTSTYEL